jgi:hypothetical protein
VSDSKHSKPLIIHNKKNLKKTKTSDWKKDGIIDLCITLYDKHASILEPYYSGSNTKELSMRRIDMCHTIATEITNYSQTKKAFNRIGIDRSIALKDCSLGMNIQPSTLMLYSYIRKWPIIHVSGCLYFITGDYDESEVINDDMYLQTTQIETNAESEKDTNQVTGTVLYHDKRYIVNWTDKLQDDIFKKCVLVNNISKPLKSQHSYKLDELKALYNRILWYNPGNNDDIMVDSPCLEKMTKSNLYSMVQRKFERAAFDFKLKPPTN